MSVWLCIPSARPPAEVEPVLSRWKEMGYKIALYCDSVSDAIAKQPDTWISAGTDGYPGYARAVNALVADVIWKDAKAEWFIAAADDTLPDPNKRADEIAKECAEHFLGKRVISPGMKEADLKSRTFGVMQPTADRFAGGSIDRIAGSAWLGREWCLSINQGKGPLWPEYTHMFVDEELQAVAQKYGVFWQRPDLVHLHRHFMRESDALDSRAVQKPIPPHLVEANSIEHWNKYKRIFLDRKAAGFPGSEPL